MSDQLSVTRAAILAGGESSRMGRDKALLPYDGAPLIARIARILAPIFPQIIVVTANPNIAAAADLPPVADTFIGRGPLGGIHAALSHFSAPTFVVACDMPHLNADFIRFLCADFDGIARVPLSENGFEPLCAVYAATATPLFAEVLRGEGKMPPLRRVLEEMGADWIAPEIARSFDANLKMFDNWNVPADIE